MKKLFNSRFLFILSLSLITLISLICGSFYLFNDDEDIFIKSGYVFNPLSEKVERYFFNDKTGYRTNLSSKITFQDLDKKDVEIPQDSFIHYLDGSLSFLKNGAILDVDSISDNKPVIFYNITNQSLINKVNKGYSINNTKSPIKLKNFIGRISEDKYIVVGDAKLSISGNENLIAADYFEIAYATKGVVNIENKEVKYQVLAEDTIIYLDNFIVDLGDKKISDKNKDIMSLTAITIDGDENVEIIPQKSKDKDHQDKDDNQKIDDGIDKDGGIDKGNGEGKVTPYEKEKLQEIIVSLKDAKVTSSSISVTYDISNTRVDDHLILKVTNLDTGRTVDIINTVNPDEVITINLLSPSTKYLLTVLNEKDGSKYFQKIFETQSFGLSLVRTYATSQELGYQVIIDDNTDITNAKLSLYKFNESTQKNEIVKTTYYDAESGENKEIEKVIWLSDLADNKEVIFDGLTSNTIYTAVLDEFSVSSANFKDIYNITLTSMTLKKSPSFEKMIAKKNTKADGFKLSLENILDEDYAIIKYTYKIYENSIPEEALITLTKSNASPIEVKVGENSDELKNDTNYFYKVIIEYFDNEKYIEYTTEDTINFVMGSDPLITVVPNETQITHNTLGATIYLTDNSCLVNMPTREKCLGDSTAVVTLTRESFGKLESTSFPITFQAVNGDLRYDLLVDNLQEGTVYGIKVDAILNNDPTGKRVELNHTDASKRTISTKTLSSFTAIYPQEDRSLSSANHVINQRVKLAASPNNIGTLSPLESAKAIQKIVLSLYEGNHLTDTESQSPLVSPLILRNSDSTNLKEMFYDNYYQITTDGTFNLDIDQLKSLSTDGHLKPEYTIKITAYYDEEREVKVENNIMVYHVLETLLLENVEDPLLIIDEITNEMSGHLFDKLNDHGTIVGYKINAVYDQNGLITNRLTPEKIKIHVYNQNQTPVDFYIKDAQNNLIRVSEIVEDIHSLSAGNYLKNIYLDYGTEYDQVDSLMSRGNRYYIGYEIELSAESGNIRYPSQKSTDMPTDYGLYELLDYTLKETPNVKMYIASSSSSSITYRYTIDDPDKAIYRENDQTDYGFYYTVNEEEEHKLALVKISEGKYQGLITLPNLHKKDVYQIYYKKNIKKSNNMADDILNYLDQEDASFLFDGYYDASQYNFNYEIYNNPLVDNRVTIKILTEDEMLNRFISYRLSFNDSQGHSLKKELYHLESCPFDDEVRCLSVDYIDLKNAHMQSNHNNLNMISLTIEALYDNGLTGYDFEVGEDKDYPYMIMQSNHTSTSYGKYFSFYAKNDLRYWEETSNIPKGYYLYSFNSEERKSLFYKSLLDPSKSMNISVGLTNLGYSSSFGILNPKMISISPMNTDSNEFSFSSITPKVKVSLVTELVNGSVEGLTLSGVDLDDFKNEGTEENPKYYLYIDTYDKLIDAENKDLSKVIRPQIKVAIDQLNPRKTINAVIDGLSPITDNAKYYFNVSAYLLKNNNYQLVSLFDDVQNQYITKSYPFKTKKSESLYTSRELSYYVPLDAGLEDLSYETRLLKTKINLTSYANSYPFNFDIVYMLCQDDTCTYDEGYIFKKEILRPNVTNEIIDEENITPYDLEYNQNYYFYLYAVASKYDKETHTWKKQYINILPSRDKIPKLTTLREPSFIITRKAKMEDNQHVIDFTVNVNDLDHTLQSGLYYIKLLDQNDQVVGTLQELNDDNNYLTISNYPDHAFSAVEINKKLRFTNLSSNTKYRLEVSGNAYVNNASETIPKEQRTYLIKTSHTIYTTDIYGTTFGQDISYVITDNSYIAIFRSGTNFDNVLKVNYSIFLDEEPESTLIMSDTDSIGEEHKFEFNDESGYGMYVIKRTDNKVNELGKYYLITLSFDIKDPNHPGQMITLSPNDNPQFSQSIIYVKENHDNS